MKYILVIIMSFAFGQDWDGSKLIETMDRVSEKLRLATEAIELELHPLETTPLLDFTLQTPATECFQILLQFQDGWLENMIDIRDSLICPNMIDVRIEYEGIIKDYTMDEFLKRLGFKE